MEALRRVSLVPKRNDEKAQTLAGELTLAFVAMNIWVGEIADATLRLPDVLRELVGGYRIEDVKKTRNALHMQAIRHNEDLDMTSYLIALLGPQRARNIGTMLLDRLGSSREEAISPIGENKA